VPDHDLTPAPAASLPPLNRATLQHGKRRTSSLEVLPAGSGSESAAPVPGLQIEMSSGHLIAFSVVEPSGCKLTRIFDSKVTWCWQRVLHVSQSLTSVAPPTTVLDSALKCWIMNALALRNDGRQLPMALS